MKDLTLRTTSGKEYEIQVSDDFGIEPEGLTNKTCWRFPLNHEFYRIKADSTVVIQGDKIEALVSKEKA
jgi:hypothetical protein